LTVHSQSNRTKLTSGIPPITEVRHITVSSQNLQSWLPRTILRIMADSNNRTESQNNRCMEPRNTMDERTQRATTRNRRGPSWLLEPDSFAGWRIPASLHSLLLLSPSHPISLPLPSRLLHLHHLRTYHHRPPNQKKIMKLNSANFFTISKHFSFSEISIKNGKIQMEMQTKMEMEIQT